MKNPFKTKSILALIAIIFATTLYAAEEISEIKNPSGINIQSGNIQPKNVGYEKIINTSNKTDFQSMVNKYISTNQDMKDFVNYLIKTYVPNQSFMGKIFTTAFNAVLSINPDEKINKDPADKRKLDVVWNLLEKVKNSGNKITTNTIES